MNQVFCTTGTGANAVTHVGPLPNPLTGAISAGNLRRNFGNRLQPLNACNCAPFFAIPSVALPANCAMAPHPKTIMLNADMVQHFPISSQTGVTNVVDTPALAIGTGLKGELCGPVVTNLASQAAPRPRRFNTNQAVNNNNLVFPAPVIDANGNIFNQGFGCVGNTVGNTPNLGGVGAGNVQTQHSSLLPKDPTANGVSLWATMSSLMSFPLGGCLEGISTYNGLMNPYGGSVKNPVNGFVGKNVASFPVGAAQAITLAQCTDPAPAFGNGRDNFYREFEIAFTKMTTVGFTYSHTFTAPTVRRFVDNAPLTLVPPGPAVTNTAINGLNVFRNPLARNAVQSITVTASGAGKMGVTLRDINLGRSTCVTAYPAAC